LAGRDVFIPQDFIKVLREHVAGFGEESERDQWGMAWMVWDGVQKRRQHRTDAGAMSYSAQEQDELFGRGRFQSLHRRIDLFQRSPGWSSRDGTTRAYWFSAQVRQALDAYAARPSTGPVNLLWLSGESMKVVTSLPRAVSSTDTNGRTTSTAYWDRAKGMNKVPVNNKMLDSLHLWLEACLRRPDGVEGPLRQFVERLRGMTVRFISMSNTTLAGPGHIPQVYSIAPTGRLYARGLNLQNAPGLIKEAALHGLWEYDFSNCHFTIVSQMAAKVGVRCPCIEHYMANKAKVRQAVADGASISLDQAKQCLLALLYGARASARRKDAIPSAIGLDAAGRLYALPVFRALSAEITHARGEILGKWPRTANGSLTNACGKAIMGRAKPTEQLAHLVQGVEVMALMTIVNLHAEDIVLLQHDGFTASRRLDRVVLEERLLRELDYRLMVEERQLELHPDARARRIRMKSEMAREAAPDIGFHSVIAD